MLVGLEEPFFAGFADQRRYGISVDDVTDFTYGFDAQHPQHASCHGGQANDDRAEDAHKDEQGWREHHRGAFWPGEGEVLRHHFTEQHVQAGHQGERDPERERVDESVRDMKGCQGPGQHGCNGGLGERA